MERPGAPGLNRELERPTEDRDSPKPSRMGFVVSHPFRDEAAERMGHPAILRRLRTHPGDMGVYQE